jgi:hypothetical protein
MMDFYLRAVDMPSLLAALPAWLKNEAGDEALPLSHRHVMDWDVSMTEDGVAGDFLANLRVFGAEDAVEVAAAVGTLAITPPAYPKRVFA